MARCRRSHSALLLAALVVALASPRARADEPRLRVGGFVQADAVAYRSDSEDELDGATGRPLNETRFLVRRAHLRADAGWRFLDGVVELEASTVATPAVRLFGAEVSARWPSAAPLPLVMLSLGLLRVPFGWENVQRDTERLFLERSAVVRALFPGENDLGVRLQGGWRVLRWQLAVMNGHPLGDATFPALDPAVAKDGIGRLGVDAPAFARVRVEAGLSGLYGTGFHAGTPATKDSVVWRDDNGDGVVQPSELHGVPGVAATPSETFRRAALGADARVTVAVPRLGALTVAGEVVWAVNLDRALLPADPVAAGRDLRELGFSAGVTQDLGAWCAVGVRYDRYDPDLDATRQAGAATVPKDGAFSMLAVAVSAQAPPWGRFTVEYDHQGNALGVGLTGAPTTLGADALTLRAQLVF